MASTKQRQRAQQARQAEKRAQRQAARRAHKQRVWGLVALVTVLALVGAFVIAALTGNEPEAAGACPAGVEEAREDYELAEPSVSEDRTWTVTLQACSGDTEADIVLELDGESAPQAVASFVTLAQGGYFDGTGCHRVTTSGIFVLQCGDPTMSGQGGPGYNFGPIENAPDDDVYPAGTVAMARVGDDAESMGSQFFLVYEESTIPADTAGGYTVFGTITSGLDFVRAVADAGAAGGASDGAPVDPVTIEGVETQ
ncbi:peptidylprolyl isomerase [Promicromonospora iranensis]|uniref:peptidylprolyl isomerase n=1 Tax=Promicromonospora iranensis TaxID=1105144 RepID=A0ABU2CVL2_9MICO|nr:peptidylprolyl isomerase [Promicromonospora iranensis]MDR7385379.1 peptidyl-prolyl cis-trans isomerase B (cyclophilin B) [Promicromonospora iranensis]